MSLRILRPGLLTTVQDSGRFGLQHLGVVPCGAMDPVALELANGKLKWEFNQIGSRTYGVGLLSTAGSLVFAGCDQESSPRWMRIQARRSGTSTRVSRSPPSPSRIASRGGSITRWKPDRTCCRLRGASSASTRSQDLLFSGVNFGKAVPAIGHGKYATRLNGHGQHVALAMVGRLQVGNHVFAGVVLLV